MSERHENIADNNSANMLQPLVYINAYRRPRLNYHCPTKRYFLNECINQIYAKNGNETPGISYMAEYNYTCMWTVLEILAKPYPISEFDAAVDRVKRKLFFETKTRPNKNPNVRQKANTKTECFYYKPQRSKLGERKISRRYLDEVRTQVYADMRQRLLKRKYLEDYDGVNESEEATCTPESKRCRYDKSSDISHLPYAAYERNGQHNIEAIRLPPRSENLEDMLLDQHYNQRLLIYDNTLEAPIRLMLYARQLMRIMRSNRHQSRRE